MACNREPIALVVTKNKNEMQEFAQRAKPNTSARAVPRKPATPKLPTAIALLGFAVEDADADAEAGLLAPEDAGVLDPEAEVVVTAGMVTVLVPTGAAGVVATVPPGVVMPASWLRTSGENVPVMPVNVNLAEKAE